MYKIGHYSLSDATLNKFIEQFVPARSVYYFNDDEILRSLLNRGVTVYTPQELLRSFPTFSLDFGSIFNIWDLSLSENVFVSRLSADELWTLKPVIQRKLMEYQVRCGRGHVYDKHWFNDLERPSDNVATVDGNWFYLLTFEDWQNFTTEVRKKWVLKWLKNRHKDTLLEIVTDDHFCGNKRVPHCLVKEYAGTFATKSGPNCFAATIAMVVADEQSHALISQWLHQEPFFRLLEARGYSKITTLYELDFKSVEPSDVMVWVKDNQVAGHAAYAVTHELVFQKHGQAWESPWQILKMKDVWYNEYLNSGGSISIYRRT